MVEAVFGNGPDLDWYQECARAALIFVYGLVLVRIAGRRIFGKWSALDIVVSIIIGSNLSRALTGSAPLWGTLIATTLLVALHWVLARLVAAFPGFSRVVEGRSIELARHGADVRVLPAQANGQPAIGTYAWSDEAGAHLPTVLQVLSFDGHRIREITGFVDPAVFPRFGLPERL